MKGLLYYLRTRKCKVTGNRFRKGKGLLSDSWSPRYDVVERLDRLELDVQCLNQALVDLLEKLGGRGGGEE